MKYKVRDQFSLTQDKRSWVGNIKVPAGTLVEVTKVNPQGLQVIVVPDERGVLDPMGGLPLVIRSWDPQYKPVITGRGR